MIKYIKDFIKKYRLFYLYIKKPLDILRFYRRDFSPPVPTYIKNKMIEKYLIKDSIFIETGTLYGDTILTLNKYFSECYTIEASDLYFDIAKKNFEDLKNVKILKGRSIDILPEIINSINHKTDKITFYLDAHYSSFNTFKDKKLSAVEEELNYIKTILRDFKYITIIVDDLRCFGSDENYPELSFLFDWSKNNKTTSIIDNDTFIVRNF